MHFLKQSTACNILLGPFIDNTDGITVLGALTILQANIRLSKNGGNMAQKNEATSATHDELGYYTCPLDATDTNTLGRLQVMSSDATAMPVPPEYFQVVTANVYDTLCSTDAFDVNLVADQSAATVGTVTTVTSAGLSALAVDAVWNEDATTHTTANSTGENLNVINDMLTGKKTIVGTTMTHFKQDGIATRKAFTLDSASSATSRTPV